MPRREGGPLREVGGKALPGVPRGAVAMDKWIEVHKARTAEVLKALAQYIRQRCGEGDVVLFGSRARGTHHALSDWDIAVITPQGQYAVEATEFGQAVHIPLAALAHILDHGMLALDIAADGVLLCGRGDYWTEYKRPPRDT